MKMLKCFVCWFMVYMSLVSEVRCGPSIDEWDISTIGFINLTMDFPNDENLVSNCGKSDLAFEFEVDWDDLIAKSSMDFYVSEREKQKKVLIITACTAAAVLATVLLYIYLTEAIITFLQSGTYNVLQHNRSDDRFHELQVTCRN